jgi:trans-aconitate methyltransferase
VVRSPDVQNREVPDRFDADYYRRFYGRRPVHTRRRVAHLCAAVSGLMAWWGLPLRSVLDVGAGPGWWRDWFAANRPGVRYRSVDVSAHAAHRFGHEQRDIATWRPARPADLVVCQGVLQYLDDAGCAAAITHLAAATRQLLYLEVPTVADRDEVLDLDASDLDVHWRPGAWYRRHLADAGLRQVGAGLWMPHPLATTLYDLEHPTF